MCIEGGNRCSTGSGRCSQAENRCRLVGRVQRVYQCTNVVQWIASKVMSATSVAMVKRHVVVLTTS